jgi:hypothetical protein
VSEAISREVARALEQKLRLGTGGLDAALQAATPGYTPPGPLFISLFSAVDSSRTCKFTVIEKTFSH